MLIYGWLMGVTLQFMVIKLQLYDVMWLMYGQYTMILWLIYAQYMVNNGFPSSWGYPKIDVYKGKSRSNG